MKAILAATALSAASAITHWEISVNQGANTHATASLPSNSDLKVVRHVFNNVFGIPAPYTRVDRPEEQFDEPVMGKMPRTPLHQRPKVGLLVTVEGGSDGLMSDDFSATLDDAFLRRSLSKTATKRDGLAAYSLEVVAPGLPALQAVEDAKAIRWDDKLGFIAQPGGKSTNTPVDEQYLGMLPCTVHGKAALQQVGFSAIDRDDGRCPLYLAPLTSGVTNPNGVYFDPVTSGEHAHLLGEAALLVTLAEGTVAHHTGLAAPEPGFLLHRLYLTSPLVIAAYHGSKSEEYTAARWALKQSLHKADGILRAHYEPTRTAGDAAAVATVVVSSSINPLLDAVLNEQIASGPAEVPAFDRTHATARDQSLPSKHSNGPSEHITLPLRQRIKQAATRVTDAVSGARHLQAKAASVATSTEVANYQVALWTAVLLAAILLGILSMMLGMDSVKDPQLHTQIAEPTRT